MSANQQHKIWIEDFWSNFGGKKNLGHAYKKKLKLEQLKRMSEIIIEYNHQIDRPSRRATFNKVKIDRHDLKTHEPCFICGGRADIRHHIIQLQNGGINSKRNLVSLCNFCHSEMHPWLKKEGSIVKTEH